MAVSVLVRRYIRRRARQLGVPCPDDINAVLAPYQKRYDGIPLRFSRPAFFGARKLNAGLLSERVILFSAEWAAQLVLFPGDETQNAFLQTVGHELSHTEDYIFYEAFTKDKKFVNWVNEVHADFGSAARCLDGSHQKLLQAVDFKAAHKTEKDRDLPSHPSRARRRQYLEHGVFDSALVEQIARDCGCKRRAVIQNVLRHFGLEDV